VELNAKTMIMKLDRLADLTTDAAAIANGPGGAKVNSHGLQPLAPGLTYSDPRIHTTHLHRI
jgi:hypothetical protein